MADPGGSEGLWQATRVVQAAENRISGIIGPTHHGVPGHVTFYVSVEDPATSLAKADKLGDKTVVPPTEVPELGLTFVFFADPEGT